MKVNKFALKSLEVYLSQIKENIDKIYELKRQYKSIFVSPSDKKYLYNRIIACLRRLDGLEHDVITVYQQIAKNRNDWLINGGMFWQTKNKIAYQVFFKKFYNPLYENIKNELKELNLSPRPNLFIYSEGLVKEIKKFVNGYKNFRKIHLNNMIESLKKDNYKSVPEYESLSTLHLKPTKPTKPNIKPEKKPSPKMNVRFQNDDVLYFKKNKPINNICKIKCGLQYNNGPFAHSERRKILECLKRCM